MQMRKKFILGATVAVFLALASVAFAADQRGRDEHGRSADARFFELRIKTLHEETIDAPPAGLSEGDRFVFSDRVFRDFKEVGWDGGECVLVWFKPGSDRDRPEIFRAQCVATVWLPEGQITVQGLVDFADEESETLAVTGGTGEFRNTGGEVELFDATEDESRLVFKLTERDFEH
jgi:hypothetical protein